MQTQSATLTAACKAKSRTPYVRLLVKDKTRRWSEKHASGSSSTRAVAACKGRVNDARILRVRLNGTTVECNRVTAVNTASQWWSWSTVTTGAVANSDVAIGWGPPGEANSIYVYFWDYSAPNYRLRAIRTYDDGATWGTVFTITAIGSPAPNYSIAASNDGTIFACWQNAGTATITRWQKQVGAGFVGATHLTSIAWSTDNGLASAYDSSADKHVLVLCYQDASGNHWAEAFNFNQASTTWGSATYRIMPIGTACSFLQLYNPSLVVPQMGDILLSLGEYWTDGTNSSSTFSLWECVSGADQGPYAHWGRPVLLPVAGSAASVRVPLVEHLLSNVNRTYAAAEEIIWQSDAFSTADSNKYAELDDVVRFRAYLGREMARATVDLANAGNRYAHFGQDGQVGAPIRPWAIAILRLGYRTEAGEEHLDTAAWLVETAQVHHDPGASPTSWLRLHLVGIWPLLQAWRAPLDFSWSSQTARTVLRQLLARAAGLACTDDGSSDFGVTVSSFSLPAGPRDEFSSRWREQWPEPTPVEATLPVWRVSADTSGYEAVWKLLRLLGLSLRMTHTGDVYALDLKNQAWSNDYTLGGGGEIERAFYGQGMAGTLRARVAFNGASNSVERYDAEAARQAGRLFTSFETRNELSSATAAASIAAGIVRQGEQLAEAARVEIPIVPGIELFDQVEVVDGRAGIALTERRSRITSIEYEYDSIRGRFHMWLGLERRDM